MSLNFVANIALYQAGWLACVVGAAHGLAWAGVAAALPILAWHFARARRAWPEARLVVAAAAAGAIFETLLAQSGWVRFAPPGPVAGFAPPWMVALWALFATTLNVSLRGLRARPALFAVLAAAGAPLAYLAGARLGAMRFEDPAALFAIAAGWAALAPLLLAAARRHDGFAPA